MCRSSGNVRVCHQRVVASFVCGATTRAAIMPITTSASNAGRDDRSSRIPSCFMAKSTASVSPWIREAVTSKSSPTAASFSPRSTRRIASIWSSGREDRLARVRLRIFLPSRQDSRSK